MSDKRRVLVLLLMVSPGIQMVSILNGIVVMLFVGTGLLFLQDVLPSSKSISLNASNDDAVGDGGDKITIPLLLIGIIMFVPPLPPPPIIETLLFEKAIKYGSDEFSVEGFHFFFDGSSNTGCAAARSNGDVMVRLDIE